MTRHAPSSGIWVRARAAALGPIVPLSFGQPGFAARRATFSDPNLDVDLRGLRYVVTGATSGIGRATALGLLERGAMVGVLARPGDKTQTFRVEAERLAPGRLHVWTCDLSDLDATAAAAADIAARWEAIDGLALNAGALLDQRHLTPQGHETSYAVHVVTPTRLLETLRPALAEAARRRGESRVVWVSSAGMLLEAIDPDDLGWTERPWDGTRAYAQAKRVQVVLAERFADELAADGIRVDAMHPGWADTPGVERSLPRFRKVLGHLLRSPEAGADTLLWLLVTHEDRGETGGFFFDRHRTPTETLPWTRTSPTTRAAIWRRIRAQAGEGSVER